MTADHRTVPDETAISPDQSAEPAPPPIFVVGCPRSGTTLLRWILDSHSAISCGPESRILWGIRVAEERNWPTLAGFGLSIDEWHAQVRALFESLHLRYAQAQGKPRWADKSPDYALMLDYIERLYPDAVIVHVVRDPRDVIDAWRRFYGTTSLVRAARAWVSYVRAVHVFARSRPSSRVHELHYEDLVRRPEPTLRALFAWLGEPWEAGVLDFAGHRHSLAPGEQPGERGGPAAGNRTIRDSSVGVGKGGAIAVPFLLVRRTGGDLLRAYGYD